MRHGIVRIVAHGGFECGAGAIQVTLACIDHGQVVIGLGQLGIVLGQLAKRRNRVLGLAVIAQRDAAQKTHLRVA